MLCIKQYTCFSCSVCELKALNTLRPTLDRLAINYYVKGVQLENWSLWTQCTIINELRAFKHLKHAGK